MSEPTFQLGDAPEEVPTAAPTEHPASPLAGLRRKREAARANLFLDLAVPNWVEEMGIDLFVRYRPIPPEVSSRIAEQQQKGNVTAQRRIQGFALALAAACEGVFYVDDDGDTHAMVLGDPDGPWPRFDERLAATLEADYVDSPSLVREVYFTDDSIANTVLELNRWSAGETRKREKEDRGN